MAKRFWAAAGLTLALAACDDQYGRSTKHLSPIPPATMALMSQKGMTKDDPILVRAYKKESEMEVWKRGRDGQYALLKTYPICRWSGQLGPKVKEGDRQAPEGFYTVTPAQLNPNSAYYLSFDTGYPNAFDRAHGRTGSALMVHGTCSSRGCYAMTDEAIAEVYAVAREAFAGGQRGFQFQAYPFRMTAENLAKHRADQHMPFWKNLKEGSDHFEALKEEPKVAVCGGRYSFGDGSCAPQVPDAVAEKRRHDEQAVADLVAKGTPAIKLVYDDGGQHVSFRETMVASAGGDEASNFAVLQARPRRNLGDVSRPEALAMGPREVVIEDKGAKKPTALAFAAAKPASEPAKAGAPGSNSKVAVKGLAPSETMASAAEPALSPGVSTSKSLYDRTFGNLLAGKPAVEADTATADERSPAPAAAPQPPRRGAETRTLPRAGKPAPEPDRRAEAPGARPVN